VWISEPFPDDRNLLLAERVLQSDEIKLRWFDADRALILPPVDGARHYLFADFVAPDPALFARWMDGAAIVLEGDAPGQAEPAYRAYRVEGGPWVERELAEITAQSSAFADMEGQQPVPLPAHFEGKAVLLGYELAASQVARDQQVHLVLYWRAYGPVYEPLSSFAHLLDAQSNVVGQYDGFDVPAWYWEPEAVIAQVYRFPINPGAQTGAHWLEAGLYNPQTMERIHIVGDDGALLGDRLLLPGVSVR